jgi:spoIIIJ-associated protein
MSETKEIRGQKWLTELLELGKISATVSVRNEVDSCWLTIERTELTDEQVVRLIGENGHALDSIQYLANAILNIGQAPEEQSSYTIELDGYRQQRQAQLREFADQVAAQVRETGEEQEIPSLSAAERRQIHTFLQEESDLETFSRGEEPDRRLVVKLK